MATSLAGPMTRKELADALARLPRVRLADLPTPLHDCPRLSAALAGPRVLIKRDDLTGLALGGNKTSALEFVLGDAVKQGADSIITSAAAQSNHCRRTAAGLAAMKLVAHSEGILLDPVYTGKTMPGLIGLIGRGILRPEHTVVFVHTGGIPALFAYREELMAAPS